MSYNRGLLLLALIALVPLSCGRTGSSNNQRPESPGLNRGAGDGSPDAGLADGGEDAPPADGGSTKDSNSPDGGNSEVDPPIEPPIPGPDLVVRYFTAWARSSQSGTRVVYNLQVCNDGDEATSQSAVDIYFDYVLAEPPTTAMAGDRRILLPALNPDQCTTIVTTWLDPAPATYESWAVIDSIEAVTEAYEDNNRRGPIVVVVDPPAVKLRRLVLLRRGMRPIYLRNELVVRRLVRRSERKSASMPNGGSSGEPVRQLRGMCSPATPIL